MPDSKRVPRVRPTGVTSQLHRRRTTGHRLYTRDCAEPKAKLQGCLPSARLGYAARAGGVSLANVLKPELARARTRVRCPAWVENAPLSAAWMTVRKPASGISQNSADPVSG